MQSPLDTELRSFVVSLSQRHILNELGIFFLNCDSVRDTARRLHFHEILEAISATIALQKIKRFVVDLVDYLIMNCRLT